MRCWWCGRRLWGWRWFTNSVTWWRDVPTTTTTVKWGTTVRQDRNGGAGMKRTIGWRMSTFVSCAIGCFHRLQVRSFRLHGWAKSSGIRCAPWACPKCDNRHPIGERHQEREGRLREFDLVFSFHPSNYPHPCTPVPWRAIRRGLST